MRGLDCFAALAMTWRGAMGRREAQESYVEGSRRFAGLLQSALAQKFSGSPSDVSTAAVRDLRSVAATAVSIEISNISSPNVSTLESMSPAIAAAIAQSVPMYQPSGIASGAPSSGVPH